MNTLMANISNNILSFLGRLQPKQLLAVVLAGVLMLATVACSNATTSSGSPTGYREKTSQPTARSNQPDALNPIQEYDDTPNAQPLKSKEMLERTTRNTATQRKAEDAATRAKSGASSSVNQAGRAVSKSVEHAVDNASDAIRNRT